MDPKNPAFGPCPSLGPACFFVRDIEIFAARPRSAPVLQHHDPRAGYGYGINFPPKRVQNFARHWIFRGKFLEINGPDQVLKLHRVS